MFKPYLDYYKVQVKYNVYRRKEKIRIVVTNYIS